MQTLRRKFHTNVFQVRRKKHNFCLFVVVSISLLVYLQFHAPDTQRQEVADVAKMTSQSHREDLEQEKLILVYQIRVIEPWAPSPRMVADGYKLTDWDGTPCEESRCRITYDRNLLNVSDAVLVHGVATKPKMSVLTQDRLSHQRWVFYNKESPVTWDCVRKSWNGLFNWTATYRRDSDFFVPYGSYVPLEGSQDNAPTIPTGFNYAKGKDRLAVFVGSNHCATTRIEFIRALMKHIPVDVYGRCAILVNSNKTWQCPHNLGQGCLEELQRHKFYLAFENSLCTDYVTEKYWRNSLERGLVPVVLGGASYGPELVIPGSFINVADFDSVKTLADYLKYLDKNDTAYNQYFQWRSKYKAVQYPFWLCRLCKALHDPTSPRKIHHNLSKFWSVENTCTLGNQRIRDIINRG